MSATHPSAPLSSPPPRVLAELCLAHLRTEVAGMQRVNAALREVRTALLAADADMLAAAFATQQQVATEMAERQAERQALRAQIAACLQDAPAQATIRQLARQLHPPLNGQLLQASDELKTLLAQSRRLAEGNALLTHNWSRVIQRVFQHLTGQPTTPERYDASGCKMDTPSPSVFQARC